MTAVGSYFLATVGSTVCVATCTACYTAYSTTTKQPPFTFNGPSAVLPPTSRDIDRQPLCHYDHLLACFHHVESHHQTYDNRNFQLVWDLVDDLVVHHRLLHHLGFVSLMSKLNGSRDVESLP